MNTHGAGHMSVLASVGQFVQLGSQWMGFNEIWYGDWAGGG
jgi:hypothetical protein